MPKKNKIGFCYLRSKDRKKYINPCLLLWTEQKAISQKTGNFSIFIAYAKNELIPTSKPSALTYKLGDLGISKTLNEIDAKNTLAQWMLPPEVLNSIEFGPIDHRLDIYHIGLLFLQIAYSKELKFTRQQILDGKPRKMALDLPMPYSLAIEKALRRHVRYRTRNTMEMWRDLQVPTK